MTENGSKENAEESSKEEAKEQKESSRQQKDDTQAEKPEDKSTDSSSSIQMSVRSVMAGVFVIGLAVGFSGGILTSQGSFSVGETTPLQPSGDSPTQPTDNTDTQQQETETIDMSSIDTEGEPVLGDEDAEVTMVIFEDFECPFCKRFEEGAFQKIESNYVETGDLKVVWKDRPLTRLHPWAEPGAAAMECIYQQGGDEAFWKVKDKVFSNQDSIEASNVESKIKGWGAEQGVSESDVQSCIDNDNPMEEVNSDSREGQRLGAGGTPTSFIDGQKIVGAQPYSNFKPVIEQALS